PRRPIATRRYEARSIGAKVDAPHGILVAEQAVKQSAAMCVPHMDLITESLGSGRQQRTIGAERETRERLRVMKSQELFSGFNIPKPGRPVCARTRQARTVRTERQRDNAIAGTGDHPQDFAGGSIPHAYGVIGTAGRESGAVWADRYAPDLNAVAA